jgi:putative glutathione S-transferase
MGVLIEGQWERETSFADRKSGEFVRQQTRFRNRITADGSSGFRAEPGRYHLYVALGCPWCHRTMIFRTLKQLEGVVSMSTVEPLLLEDGWSFAEPDPLTGARYIYQVYQRADPRYTGRASVPILWDKQTGTIVSNESSEIIRMFNSEFAAHTPDRTDFYPPELAAEIDTLNARIYETVNNGVYRAGFSERQEAYEQAVKEVFAALDWLEARLSKQRYLAGSQLTEADWRLFPTLIRFDAAYYGHFKCNLRHLYEYPALWGYTRELYQHPGIAGTCSLEEYKTHYYGSHGHINPTRVVPLGPELDLMAPHGRESLRPA